MANPTLDALAAQVTASLAVEASALALIGGISANIQAAIATAIAGGASAADLAPVQDEVNKLNDSAAKLADAVAANTPAAATPAVVTPAPTPAVPPAPTPAVPPATS